MPVPNYPSKRFIASESPLREYIYTDVPASGASPGGTILFLHGFPDTSYTWTYLIDHFSSRGFRCLAPDLLGYGRSSRPSQAEGRLHEYSFQNMSRDLAGLVAHAQPQGSHGKVIVVSHDWGAGLAWRFTQYYKELVQGMCAVCVPYFAMHDVWIPREVITSIVPSFGYQAFFEDQKSTQIIQDNIETFLRGALSSPGLFTRSPDADPEEATPEKEGVLQQMLISGQKVPPQHRVMLDEDTFKFYLQSYSAPEQGGQGMEGGLNWYRTRRINYEDELKVKDKKYPSSIPVLMVVPELDAALPPFLFRDLTKHLSSSQLERRDIPQCGHFVQLEQPALLIQALEEWITRWNLVEGDKNRDGKL